MHWDFQVNQGPHPLDLVLGERLRAARVRRNFKQSDMAQALGVSAQQIQKYEAGHNRISATRLVELAAFLGVQPGDLLEKTSAPSAGPARLPSERGARKLMNAWAELTPRARSRLLELAEEMADLSVRARGRPRPDWDRLRKNTEFP